MGNFGLMGVDFEQRVDFDRLRRDRLAKTKAQLDQHRLGSLLLFDPNNIRYVTGAHIGEWQRDKMARTVFVPAGGDPILWELGSAVKVKKANAPWLKGQVRPTRNWMRGAVPPDVGLVEDFVKEIKGLLEEHGLANEPVGIDMGDAPLFLGLLGAGVKVVDGQQAMLDARMIKTADEIELLEAAAMMVDAAYGEIVRHLRAGIRENELVAIGHKVLFDLGSEDVECINCVSGPRTNPHPHLFSDRVLRPGDLVFLDMMHAYNGYRTCYYRTLMVGKPNQQLKDAYKQCYDWLYESINVVKPGATTADIAKCWPPASHLGFQSEADAFALQFGHGIGTSIWEKPVVSRMFSLEKPFEIQEGMVFALETYCGTKDGTAGARIEEEIVVTKTGGRVITKFPCDELVAVDV